MKLFHIIANDIMRNPDAWTYEEHYLCRSIPRGPTVKITYFCNKPYVLLVNKVSFKAGPLDKMRLWWAGKKWLQAQFDGIEMALDAALPLDQWIKKRNAEVAKRAKST